MERRETNRIAGRDLDESWMAAGSLAVIKSSGLEWNANIAAKIPAEETPLKEGGKAKKAQSCCVCACFRWSRDYGRVPPTSELPPPWTVVLRTTKTTSSPDLRPLTMER